MHTHTYIHNYKGRQKKDRGEEREGRSVQLIPSI